MLGRSGQARSDKKAAGSKYANAFVTSDMWIAAEEKRHADVFAAAATGEKAARAAQRKAASAEKRHEKESKQVPATAVKKAE